MPLNKVDLETHDTHGYTPLTLAVDKFYLRMASVLLQNGALIDSPEIENGTTSLMRAALNCDNQMVSLLLTLHPNVNAMTPKKETALMFSSFREQGDNCFETVKLLVKAGARIDPKNRDGKSAIDLFAEQKRTEIVNYLESELQK